MKKLILVLVVALGFSFSSVAQDKKEMADKMDSKIIALEQTGGEFTQKGLTVSAGTYVFEVSNNAVDHNVGFVLVKKGADASNPKNHIQTAYVTKQVATGEKQHSNPTTLEKGEYVYFCPLNPTPQYTLTVE